jgi:Ca2+-binding EF-hand superfamily protein
MFPTIAPSELTNTKYSPRGIENCLRIARNRQKEREDKEYLAIHTDDRYKNLTLDKLDEDTQNVLPKTHLKQYLANLDTLGVQSKQDPIDAIRMGTAVGAWARVAPNLKQKRLRARKMKARKEGRGHQKIAPRLRGERAWTIIADMVRRLEAHCDQRKTRLVDAFRRFDINKDGTVSPEEMHQCFVELGFSLTADENTMLLYHLDADGDGEVDVGELLELVRESHRHVRLDVVSDDDENSHDAAVDAISMHADKAESREPFSGGFRVGNQLFLMSVADGDEAGSFSAKLLIQNTINSAPEELVITAQTAAEAGLGNRKDAFSYLRDDLVRVYEDTVKRIQATMRAEGQAADRSKGKGKRRRKRAGHRLRADCGGSSR